MRIRTAWLHALTWLLVLAASWSGASPAAAQHTVRIDPQAVVQLPDLQQVLQKGDQLEQQRRWGEALAHYEQALRDYPGQVQLEQRLTLARLHYDIARRYADANFVTAVRQMDKGQAQQVYGEVLQKIQTHYVDQPQWQTLARTGLSSLDAALSEPTFLETHRLSSSVAQLRDAQQQLYRVLETQGVRSRNDAERFAAYAAETIQHRCGLPASVVLMEYSCGAMAALDEYSTFLTGTQLDEVFSQIEGNFVGLGIELRTEDKSLLVVHVIPASPAAEGGLRDGDRILSVDGQAVAQVTSAVAADMLKGPEGSIVRVAVQSADGTSRTLQLVRRRVEVPSVEDVRILDDETGTAYLKLSSFQRSTAQDVDRALWDLYRQGMKALIIDVRGNPGGLLDAAVEVADKFVNDGAIVSTRGRNAREDYDYRAHAAGTWRVPLVVLIDGDSASASEIFAGAIRDHNRGTVIGVRSYGKGSVQGIFPLSSSRVGLRLTTAKFYSPGGHAISRQGVSPHITVHAAAKPAEPAMEPTVEPAVEQPDTVLQAALHVLRQRLAPATPDRSGETTAQVLGSRQ